MSDIYPVIPDKEFRGDGYYSGTLAAALTLPTVPYIYKGTFRVGDKVILQTIDKDLFAVRGVIRDGIVRDPYPTYITRSVAIEYQINRKFLTDIQPRTEVKQ